MRQLRCPQCGNPVTVADGQAPVCGACGFGAPAQNPYAAPAKKGGLGAGAIVAIVLAAILVIGGIAAGVWYLTNDDGGDGPGWSFSDDGGDETGSGPLTQAEAEQALAAALTTFDGGSAADPTSFASSLSDPFIPELRRISGDVTGSDEFFGNVAASFEFEWGSGDVTHMAFSVSSGAITITMETYCRPGADYVVFGATVYETRPTDDEECSDILETEPTDDASGGDTLSDMEIVSVTPNSDGSVSAVLQNETARVELEIDAAGRITSMQMTEETPEGSFTMDMVFEYGDRQPIVLPTATAKMPADVSISQSVTNDETLVTIESAPTGLPRDEFQLRVHSYDCECTVATFDLAQPAGTSGDFAYEWIGDADGSLETGDTFRITYNGPDEYFASDMILWDEWANAEVGSAFLPGPSMFLLGTALVGAVIVARRRR